LLPAHIGERLPERALRSLVTDLVGSGVVVAPIVVVTGRELELPFTVYSTLGSVLLDGATPPTGMTIVYRGSDVKAALEAIPSRDVEDVVVCFADVRPFFADIRPERAHAVLLFALAAARDIELHLPELDENFREIPGKEYSVHRACNAVVVRGTDLDGPKYRPVGAIAQIVERHLGPLQEHYDILH
jgi:hypothetical protein